MIPALIPKQRKHRVRLHLPEEVAAPATDSITPQSLAYALPGGLAKLAYPKWMYNPFIRHIEDQLLPIAEGKSINVMFSAPPRHGKRCSDNTPVLTTKGWTTHGKLCVGDFVFGPDGQPTMVVHLAKKGPVKHFVELSNGERIYCHLNHEWTVYDKCLRKWVTAETRDLRDRIWVANRQNLYLPLVKAVRFSKKELPLHPYVLGYWLGNGNSSSGTISHNEDDVEPIEAIEKALSTKSNRRWVMEGTKSAYAVFNHCEEGSLYLQLKALGLKNNKHIPEIYLRSSIKQRLKLLAGLIDSDGYVDRSSRVVYVTTNEVIRDGVMDLCTSLGFRPYYRAVQPELSTSGVQGTKVCYYICFQPTMNIPTKVPRKKIMRFAKQRRLSIVKIGRAEKNLRGRSIMVDRPDGLYLVGKKLVPTHNTMYIDRVLPAWFLGRNPDKRVLLITYQDGFSRTQSRAARNIFKRYGHEVFGLRVAEDTQAANQWDIQDHEGGMEAVGSGGAITGKGAHLLIIDDLIKGMEQALNESQLEKNWDWFLTDVMSRLEPGASVVIIMTRWTMGDIIGKILDQQSLDLENEVSEDDLAFDDFRYFNYPALAVENDILGRQPGQALFRQRYDETALRKIRNRSDDYWWEALYQGNPIPLRGDIIDVTGFKRRYKEPPEREKLDMVVVSLDTASKDTELADYSVFTIWGIKSDGYYLLDVIREKLTYPKLVETAKAVNSVWRPEFFLVEDKGSGISLIQDLREDMSVNVWPMDPGTESKVLRMQAETPVIKAGMILLPDEASWLDDFLIEMRSFPRGKKDQVDSLSQFLKFMRQTSSGVQMF